MADVVFTPAAQTPIANPGNPLTKASQSPVANPDHSHIKEKTPSVSPHPAGVKLGSTGGQPIKKGS